MKTLLIHPDELSRKWIDRMKSVGCTSVGIHPEGGKSALESLENLIKKFDDKKFTELLDYAESKDLKIEYHMHALEFLLDREYFSSHPQWFRQNENGERCKKHNFCVTNKEALKIVCENALTLAKGIKKANKKSTIVFCSTKSADKKHMESALSNLRICIWFPAVPPAEYRPLLSLGSIPIIFTVFI